ncbi:tetratricopeptide repeat protein, partial [Massilia jejuensis]
ALAEQPGYPEAACVRANALFQLRRFEAALRAYDAAVAADAGMPEAHAGRGLALLKLGRAREALACFETALALRPGHPASHRQRGEALLALGERSQAIAAFGQARESARQAGQDAADIDFALAALGVGAPPERAPLVYVKALFDQYAGHFDRHLTGVLDYRTPALIGAALARHAGAAHLATADLGCGTGLCAPFLRPLARSLAGVDLSARMLEQARATGLYDELARADIGAWLEARADDLDLVVAADVLVYFGPLETLFAQVRRALRPGGWFCFSTEAIEADAGPDHVLLPSSRYAHSPDYLRRLARERGFVTVEAERAVVRSEDGAGVAGHLLVLRAA